MKITNPITLDVARSNSYICLLAKQFDENSRFLIATLTNNGAPMIIPAGAAVTLRATRPDGEPVAVPGIINNDGTTTVEIDDYILEVVGSASLSIEVAIGDEILTSASFNLTIQRADGNGWLRVYVAAASLAAGNYYITIGDTPYAFTTTQAIPAGGSIYFASEGGTAQTRDASGNVLDASLTLTAGTSGTELTSDVPTMSFLTAIAGRMATVEAEMPQKANIDGSYPLLHAGTADDLIADTGATQAIPFIQEGTGKGNGEATVKAGGVLQLKKKLGNTVAVNQLAKELNSTNYIADSASVSFSGGVATITASARYGGIHQDLVAVPVGHMVFMSATIKLTTASNQIQFLLQYSGGTAVSLYTQATTNEQIVSGILSVTGGTAVRLAVRDNRASDRDAFTVKNIRVIDLTLWYGSNDRIPSDLLSHPENWGRYYAGSLAYNAGTLGNADGTALKSIGRNVWDEEWESGLINQTTGQNAPNADYIRSKNYIPIIPGQQYYKYVSGFSGTNRILYYDANKAYMLGSAQVLNTGTMTPPAGAAFARFYAQGNTYASGITISLYYSGESGYDTYYPYSVLAEVDTGSEVLRSAGAVADEKTPDGTITRRVGAVDLGTLTWTYTNQAGHLRFEATVPAVAFVNNTTPVSAMCSKYLVSNYPTVYANTNDKIFAYYNSTTLLIYDSAYTTAAAFKTAMSGVYLYYELATPTTEQGTAFAENIPCDPDGTLNWTQSAGVPQGNEIFYPTDLKGALESIVAALPSANGTYTLHATVTTAGVTFSWS